MGTSSTEYKADNGCGIFYCGHVNLPPRFPVRLLDGTPIGLVVGDDLSKAASLGILKEARLQIEVANMHEREGITVKVNGDLIDPAGIRREKADTFEVAVTTPPIRRGINQVVITLGLNSRSGVFHRRSMD